MVGSARFELAASSTRTRRATKLRYDPMEFRTRQTACPQNQMTVYSFETISQRRFTHACRAASATRRRRSVPIEEERGCGPDQEERCVPPWRVDKMESAHNGVGNSFYSGSAESRLVAVRFAFRRWTWWESDDFGSRRGHGGPIGPDALGDIRITPAWFVGWFAGCSPEGLRLVCVCLASGPHVVRSCFPCVSRAVRTVV